MFPSDLPLPHPVISGSGTIGLYWEGNGNYASIEFDGSGYCCHIADRPNDEGGVDRIAVSEALTRRLSEVIGATTVEH